MVQRIFQARTCFDFISVCTRKKNIEWKWTKFNSSLLADLSHTLIHPLVFQAAKKQIANRISTLLSSYRMPKISVYKRYNELTDSSVDETDIWFQ